MSSRLFEPLALGRVTVPNRIAVAPICQCQAKKGQPQPWHFMHYSRMACSGAGLVIVEATAVQMQGRITTRCLALSSLAQKRVFARLVRACKNVAPETKFFLELSHAGRKGGRRDPALGRGPAKTEDWGFDLVAPSASRYDASYPEARALSEEEILGIIDAFAQSARWARAAGFDGLVLHAAHGYLLHQFLSPLTNLRTDAWGGDAVRRRRFVLEVVKAVVAAVPDMPVMMRVSAGDCVEGGWTMDEAVELLKE
ncbi:MAG: NADH:flavin oxidoreductase/NADH oxidase, partial [Duodenibacillus sp.]